MQLQRKLSPTIQREAFTLLELLIVIVVIGILASLLFVAFGGALGNVNVVTVSAEITQLEQSLTQFKSDFGVIPPSQIVLTEVPGTTPWDAVSKTVLRRMFGTTVDFSQQVDFNNDGDTTDVITLTSSECLVFFLGGMIDGADNTTLTGFSGNKEFPFARGGENRIGPFFSDFDPSRLIDADGDGMPEFRDQASSGTDVSIVYASSNNGQGYSDSDGSVAHYHGSDGSTPINKDSFQLISAGADGDFGFVVESTPFAILQWVEGVGPTGGVSESAQSDNITNFAGGTLGQ